VPHLGGKCLVPHNEHAVRRDLLLVVHTKKIHNQPFTLDVSTQVMYAQPQQQQQRQREELRTLERRWKKRTKSL
jgi:hypothetical protein